MWKISAILISFLLIVPVLLSMVNADVSQNELDEERLTVWKHIPLKYRLDRIDGGTVFGLFVVFNGKEKAHVILLFRKIVPPGHVALDMLCTKISILVIDCNQQVFSYVELKKNDHLFVNNWFDMLKLDKPDYGKFYTIEIKIYGNYE